MKTSSVETSLTRETTGSVRFDRGPAGHDWLTTARASAVLGGLMIAAGLLVSSAGLAAFLRGASGPLSGQLILGATLFRIGLVVLGAAIIALGNVRIWTAVPEEQSAPANSSGKLVPVVLTLIIGVATALRLYGLNAGLWYDEIVTDVLYARLPYGSIVTTFDSENQHFLYSILAHTSIQVFGDNAWALRLPAVVFGVGSIWALYLLGTEVANNVEALFSAALLALSYTHIWFSQDARGYSGLLCMAVLSSWLFLRSLRTARPRTWILYAIAAALGMYVHVTMLFVLMAHFLIFAQRLVARRKQTFPNRWAGLFIGFGLSGVLAFQLYALALPEMLGTIGKESGDITAWKQPAWTLLQLAAGVQASFGLGIVAIGALLVFGLGCLHYLRTYPQVLCLLVVPVVVGTAGLLMTGHYIWPRFYFLILGFAVLITIRGTMMLGALGTRLLRRPDRSGALGVVLCTCLVLASAVSVPRAYGPKQDYLAAAQFVDANEMPGDTVVTLGLAAFPYMNYYDTNWTDTETLDALNAARHGAKRTWLVYTFPPVLEDFHPELLASIQREFHVVKEFPGTVGGGAIYVCLAEDPPQSPGPGTAGNQSPVPGDQDVGR